MRHGMVHGVRWCTVYGVRCTVCGVRCAVCGVRCPVSGVRCPVSGVRCSAKASLSVPDLSKLGKKRYMYRTCTQTWLTQSLLFKSYNCVSVHGCGFFSQKGFGWYQMNLSEVYGVRYGAIRCDAARCDATSSRLVHYSYMIVCHVLWYYSI